MSYWSRSSKDFPPQCVVRSIGHWQEVAFTLSTATLTIANLAGPIEMIQHIGDLLTINI